MENINLSTTTDRYIITTRSTIPAPLFVTIGESPLMAIDTHQHRHRSITTSWTWLYFVVLSSVPTLIGNSSINKSPLLHLPIYASLTPDRHPKIRVQKRCQHDNIIVKSRMQNNMV